MILRKKEFFINEEEKLLYKPTDLISLFGLSKNTIYAMIKMDGFPAIEINGKKYIPAKELDKWISKNVGRSLSFSYT
ncbi:helix-turn-helix domain-containing protein [Enterococcus sp.]|uniref:helix-turn-helix domain-containing protein n=1 Tax=Enterococcus sp. TaxID=35783 RepID=UPI0037C0570A